MRKILPFFLTLIIFLFGFSSESFASFSPSSAQDLSFYGEYCQSQEWRWLCQVGQTELAALKEEDGWELVLDDFAFFGQNRGIEFVFPALENGLENPVLVLSLRAMGETFGWARLEIYQKDTWQMVWGGVGQDRLVFYGDKPWREEVNLKEVLGGGLEEELKEGLRVRLQVGPLVSSSYVLPAIDQAVIIDKGNQNEILTPTLGITLALSLTPTATPMVFPSPTLTSTLTPTATPTPTGTIEENKVVWIFPQDGETVSGKVILEARLEEEGEETKTLREVFFWRPLGQNSWQQLAENIWETENLPLGEYQLQTKLTSEEGEEKSAEIVVSLGARIFNVFLTGRTLSWQTDRPTLGRIIYDRASHLGVEKNYPNFGYLWASEPTSRQKQTSHQFTFGQIPAGRYYYRILAFGSPVSYSDEYVLETDSLLIEEEKVLGQAASAEASISLPPTPEENGEEVFDQSQPLAEEKPFNFPRFLALFLLGVLAGGGIVHLTKKEK
ncbi:MAG: hypothetical protein ACOX5S_00490 [Patescibacteria group bacterium]|jgi:hypothetical protein